MAATLTDDEDGLAVAKRTITGTRYQRPNTRVQLTPLRGERERGDFETRIRPDRHLGLSVRRN